jgi:hypothetical protein
MADARGRGRRAGSGGGRGRGRGRRPGGGVLRGADGEGAVKLVTPRGKPLRGRWQSCARTDGDRARAGAGAALSGAAEDGGCVYTRRPRTIYVRPRLRDPRGVLLHELGHVFDLTVMNNRDGGRDPGAKPAPTPTPQPLPLPTPPLPTPLPLP